MRTFKFNVITLILMLMLLTLLSCGNTQHWVFKYSVEEIESIEIIEFDMMSDGYTVLSELDKELFDDVVADVSAIEFKYYGTNLASQTGRGIKISFATGEYDIITAREPKHFEHCDHEEHAHGFDAFNSWLECEETQLDALIEKYFSN